MKTYRLFTLLTGFALGTGIACADTQSDIDDFKSQKLALQSELKKLDVRVTQTDSLAKDEAKRFVVTEQRQQDDIGRRKVEFDSLQVKIALVAKDLQAEKNKQSGYQLAVENTKSFRKGVTKDLAQHCRDLETLIAQSLPWDRESRLDRVGALRRDLETGNASPEEGLSRIRAIYAEETRFGDEVVLINRPMVRSDGETVNARVLRIGNQWMLYSDEDGNKYGLLVRSIGKDGKIAYSWKEDFSFEERTALKLAIEVKMARKPPQMVSLPLSLSIEKEEK